MIPHISPLQDDDAPNSINIPSQNRRRPGFTKEMVLAGLTIKSGTSAWDISQIDYLKHTCSIPASLFRKNGFLFS